MFNNGVQGSIPMQPTPVNPLQKHFRQPKIFIRLPSGGKYWPAGTIDMPENGELPVYPMTAKDELVLKTPDALMNGESTTRMMTSCLPNIKDASACPSIDLDAILVAIRIATYGESMSVKGKIPNTDIEKDYEINLIELLDRLQQNQYPETFKVDEFTFSMRPTTYKTFTDLSLMRFEEERKLRQINDNNTMKDADKLKIFNDSFHRLTNITLDTVVSHVTSVQYLNEDPVTDPAHIHEFFANVDSALFEKLQKYIEDLKSAFSIPDFDAVATQEEMEAGAPETYKVPVMFDQSNFFARR